MLPETTKSKNVLPSTRELHLEVVGSTKKFRWGGGISGLRDRAVELCLQKLITSAPRNNQKQKCVAKYKGIASRSSRKYKKVQVGGGGISGSRDRTVVVS